MSRHFSNDRRISTVLGALAVAIFTAQFAFAQFTWVQDTSGDGTGNWDDDLNWSGTGFPDAAGATATFTQPVRTGTGAYTVTLPDIGGAAGEAIVGALTIDNTGFNNAVNFNLSAHSNGSRLVFQSPTSDPATYSEPAGTAVSGPGRTTLNSFIDVRSDLNISHHNIPSLNTGTVWTNIITGDPARKITLNGSTANLQLNDATAHMGTDGYRGEWIINEGGLRLIGIGAIHNSKGVTVTDGGQLQLGQNNAVAVPDWRLATGATIGISGTGKTGGNSSDGALRFQLNGTTTTTLHNGVVLNSPDARITVQNGAGSVAIINNIVSGDGGLNKTGIGTLVLNNFPHSYLGDTTNFGGGSVLRLMNEFLNDDADVRLTTGGTLDMAYTGTDEIRTLFIDNVAVTETGLWGRTGHPSAEHFTDLITGDGLLLVSELPAPPGIDGDYNNDGVVDAADYVMWQKLTPNASNGLPVNDATPTTIGNDDYDTWVSNFGMSESGSGGNAAVPEPATGLSLLVAVMLGAVCRRRR